MQCWLGRAACFFFLFEIYILLLERFQLEKYSPKLDWHHFFSFFPQGSARNNTRALILQGGIKAVVWTDVVQLLLMLTGLLVVIIQVTALGVSFEFNVKFAFYFLCRKHVDNTMQSTAVICTYAPKLNDSLM